MSSISYLLPCCGCTLHIIMLTTLTRWLPGRQMPTHAGIPLWLVVIPCVIGVVFIVLVVFLCLLVRRLAKRRKRERSIASDTWTSGASSPGYISPHNMVWQKLGTPPPHLLPARGTYSSVLFIATFRLILAAHPLKEWREIVIDVFVCTMLLSTYFIMSNPILFVAH